jgi:hypothetical protein
MQTILKTAEQLRFYKALQENGEKGMLPVFLFQQGNLWPTIRSARSPSLYWGDTGNLSRGING